MGARAVEQMVVLLELRERRSRPHQIWAPSRATRIRGSYAGVGVSAFVSTSLVKLSTTNVTTLHEYDIEG